MRKNQQCEEKCEPMFNTSEMRNKFALRLSKLRTQKNISARKMSNALDFSQSYLSKVESGEMQPSMDKFFAICIYLGITPAEFFAENIEKPQAQNELLGLFSQLNEENSEMILSLCRKLVKSQGLK